MVHEEQLSMEHARIEENLGFPQCLCEKLPDSDHISVVLKIGVSGNDDGHAYAFVAPFCKEIHGIHITKICMFKNDRLLCFLDECHKDLSHGFIRCGIHNDLCILWTQSGIFGQETFCKMRSLEFYEIIMPCIPVFVGDVHTCDQKRMAIDNIDFGMIVPLFMFDGDMGMVQKCFQNRSEEHTSELQS